MQATLTPTSLDHFFVPVAQQGALILAIVIFTFHYKYHYLPHSLPSSVSLPHSLSSLHSLSFYSQNLSPGISHTLSFHLSPYLSPLDLFNAHNHSLSLSRLLFAIPSPQPPPPNTHLPNFQQSIYLSPPPQVTGHSISILPVLPNSQVNFQSHIKTLYKRTR